MGKSRSVTVALAYLLSTRRHLDLASALALIRETRPMAEPNDGFMQQLQLYADMGCPADMDAQPAYQRWLYQKDVELSLATGRAPDRLRFEDEEQQELQTGETVRRDVASASDKELRCRKCRRTLATGLYLIPHQTRASDPAPPLSPYEPISSLAPPVPNPAAAENLEGACTHHFIHPLSWMRPTLERAELAGRLECPNAKCGALVGRYAWQGLKCSCGKWVVPGFSLQAGRVDEVVKGKMGEAGVRMPPGMLRGDLPGKGNL
ncbi:MAG: tyrosine protein phosphatase yvh1 [Claussenomyces sp. TS43310]|nr:MAG: tyrosine protein phosphatase yvh1 [Claussenomyces sp. TS43310]